MSEQLIIDQYKRELGNAIEKERALAEVDEDVPIEQICKLYKDTPIPMVLVGNSFVNDLVKLIINLRNTYSIYKLMGVSRITNYKEARQSNNLIILIASADEYNSLLRLGSITIDGIAFRCINFELATHSVRIPDPTIGMPHTLLVHGCDENLKPWLSFQLQAELEQLNEFAPSKYLENITGIFLVLNARTQKTRNFFFITLLNYDSATKLMNIMNIHNVRSVIRAEKSIIIHRVNDGERLQRFIHNGELLICSESISLNWLITSEARGKLLLDYSNKEVPNQANRAVVIHDDSIRVIVNSN